MSGRLDGKGGAGGAKQLGEVNKLRLDAMQNNFHARLWREKHPHCCQSEPTVSLWFEQDCRHDFRNTDIMAA